MEDKGIKYLFEKDHILKKIIGSIPVPSINSTNNVFFDLMSCILEQQIHYRSTKKVFQKMLEKACIGVLTAENFHQFEESVLSTANLSIKKYETALRIVEFWDKNKINWNLLNDNEVIKQLSSIKGVGKWTIDMILLYTLQRPNVFPYDDFHLKQIMVNLYNLNSNLKLKEKMITVAESWGEYKSLAVLYLLAWKEYNKVMKFVNKENFTSE